MARTTYTFYFMHEPENELCGYVGMTTEPIQKRIRRHIYEATGREHSPESEKNVWLRLMLDRGLHPYCEVLEVSGFKDPTEAGIREQYWIKRLREEGKYLTNMTDGGLGTNGYYFEHKEETKEKLAEAATKYPDALEKAIEMRKAGATYKDIYTELGMSRSNFYKEYKEKVKEATEK